MIEDTDDWRELLRADERSLVDVALQRLVASSELEDWEFATVVGYDRAEVESFSRTWQTHRAGGEAISVVIATVNTLLGYPGIPLPAGLDRDLEALLQRLLVAQRITRRGS